MRKLALIALLLATLIACVPALPHPSDNVNTSTDGTMDNKTDDTDEPDRTPLNETPEPETPATNETKETPEESGLEPADDMPVKEFTEGELVRFPNLQATDPDGDPITYTFTSPLNNEGTWQTSEGDAGDYIVTITASDGANTVSQDVKLIIHSKNKPPVIEIEDAIEAAEGDTVTLEPVVTDPDGDETSVTYTGWMTSNTKDIGYDEAGNKKVIITASDGANTATKEVIITVADTNRPPEIQSLSPINVKEGDLVTVNPSATDPDGDDVTYSYDFPLNEEGTWDTEIGDAGDYEIEVTASDGSMTADTTVLVSVEAVNRAPVIELSSPITVSEGDTVTLEPVITDKEGDEIRVSYTGWMTSSTRETTYEDAGEHSVTIIARDTAGGETRHDITIIVEDVNRPPVFGDDAFN